jgi:hypothetical protein
MTMFTTGLTKDIMCETRSGNRIYWMVTAEKGAQVFELRYIEIPVGGRSTSG